MKASSKMRKAIARIEKKYGEMEKDFGVEFYPQNRRGNGFYDYVILTCPILKSLNFTINHEGEIFSK